METTKPKFKKLSPGEAIQFGDQVKLDGEWYGSDAWRYRGAVGQMWCGKYYRRPLNDAAHACVSLVNGPNIVMSLPRHAAQQA